MTVSLYKSRATNHADATAVTIATLNAAYGVKQIGTAKDGVIVELPFASLPGGFFLPDASHRWFLLHDNGGEVGITAINLDRCYASVPFDTVPPVTAELMAYRIAVVMAGGRIDWSVTDFPSIADFIGGASAPLIITCNQEVQP